MNPADLAVILALVCGCAIGPDYAPPKVEPPPEFRTQPSPASAKSFADLPWWDVYSDRHLSELISVARANNYDLRIAVSRVEQARAVAAQTRALLFPHAGYGYSLEHGSNQFLGSPALPSDIGDNSSLAQLTASWEIDLWGRLRRMNERDRAKYLGTIEARNGVEITLVSEMAQAYFNLLALDLELEIARRTAASFDESLRIFTERLEGGVASKLEVTRAQAALANAAAFIPDYQRQSVIRENQISILLGANPGPVERGPGLLAQYVPPDIPAGIPSRLLERRPDIRQAAQLLRAANAQVGVAMGDFLPQLTLTAMGGSVSDELWALNRNGDGTWGVGGGVQGPIFQGGRLVAQYQQARSARDEARLHYEQTALNALQEVANALIAREKLAEARKQQETAVSALTESVKVATERYLAGKASYYEVLEAQQQLFPTENALAQTRLNQLIVIVQLYKALGGGWETK